MQIWGGFSCHARAEHIWEQHENKNKSWKLKNLHVEHAKLNRKRCVRHTQPTPTVVEMCARHSSAKKLRSGDIIWTLLLLMENSICWQEDDVIAKNNVWHFVDGLHPLDVAPWCWWFGNGFHWFGNGMSCFSWVWVGLVQPISHARSSWDLVCFLFPSNRTSRLTAVAPLHARCGFWWRSKEEDACVCFFLRL